MTINAASETLSFFTLEAPRSAVFFCARWVGILAHVDERTVAVSDVLLAPLLEYALVWCDWSGMLQGFDLKGQRLAHCAFMELVGP